MTRPRNALVSLEATRYYHVMSRCVRQAFLMGTDKKTGKDYSHRRAWIEARIHLLASIFAIDVCSYAVMSNHYHITVRLSPEQLDDESDRQIAERWQQMCKGSLLFQKYLAGETLKPFEKEAVSSEIAVYRHRLTDLSWFMRQLNLPLAIMANREDGRKGTFVEARFKSQALCNEEALLSCMAYVDLNPVRAAIAKTPEDSDHTSFQHRIKTFKAQPTIDLKQAIEEQYAQSFLNKTDLAIKPLLAFNPDKAYEHHELPFKLSDYIELVEWTGRIIRNDKRGHIDNDQPLILKRLNIDSKRFITQSTQFEAIHRKRFGNKPAIQNSA